MLIRLVARAVSDQSQAWADASLSLAKQHELRFVIVFAEGVLGWILGRRGATQGADSLLRSVQLQCSMGVNLWVPLMSAWLAENLLHVGNVIGAVSALERGLKVARQSGVTAYDAELTGLHAEVISACARDPLSGVSTTACAEEPYELARRSYSIAAAQQFKSLQLRAAARLLRLATTNIRIDEAYALLSDVYASFSEGLHTPDLLDARKLLNSVRAGPTSK